MPPKRVLLIDDEPDIREVARVALERVGGWTVLLAESGRDGFSIARRERPDAIVLDLMMPDLDGAETLRLLQADAATATIPVVLLTAKKGSANRGLLDGLGAAGFIPKPFDPMTLADQIAHLVGWPD